MHCLVETARRDCEHLRPQQNEIMKNQPGSPGNYYKMPESFRALLRIVSFTAANTSRMLEVSVACVRLRVKISTWRKIGNREDIRQTY